MGKIIKILLLPLGYFLMGILGFVILYILLSFILSLIPVNNNFNDTFNGIEIYILSNNVHTDLVLPVRNEFYDWSRKIKYSDAIANDNTVQYLAFGWGDKGFYLETPTWADLKFKTAFKAAFFLGTSAMHVTFYTTLQEGKLCKKLTISPVQYQRLINYIEQSFQEDSVGNFIHILGHSYGNYDAFYQAKKTYNLFFTCNTWTNQALKKAGIKTALWTPIDKGILWHY
jgi:uncharacterized protein (TIGR02117 family)